MGGVNMEIIALILALAIGWLAWKSNENNKDHTDGLAGKIY
jgi:hypothetical protein